MKKLLALVLALALFAAPAAAEAPTWINSTLIGSVASDTDVRLQDDFSLAINKAWLSTATLAPGQMEVDTFVEQAQTVREQIMTLLQGEPQQNEAGKLVQRFYHDYVDMDTRNAQGMSPVMPYIEALRAIQSLDDLTAYMLRDDTPYNLLYGTSVSPDSKDSTHNAVHVVGRSLTLGDAGEYKTLTSVGERMKQAYSSLLLALLARVGYAPETAQAAIDLMLDIETKMAATALTTADQKQPDYYEKIYNPMTLDELTALSPTFPIAQLLHDCTERGVERFILVAPDDLVNMNVLYTQENLEAFKAFFLCRTLMACQRRLDQTCMDLADEATGIIAGMTYHSVLTESAYSACNTMLPMTVGRMYAENFVSEAVKQDVAALVDEVVAVFQKRLTNATWMSEETRAQALEKLDSLTVRVAYPDDWSAYDDSGIVFKSIEEGGSLLEDMAAITRYNYYKELDHVLEPIDHTLWKDAPQTTNAYYRANDNSINILAGVLGGELYSLDASREQKMGTIGYIIGHEITHAFDTTGSQFDKDGNLCNWWTDADHAAFTALTDKVDAYFSAIEALPGKHVDGKLTIGETVADLGGLSCMLEIASADTGFDYEAFFTAFARVWKAQMPEAVAELLLMQDPHAPHYLRTNVTVQQFQEFYDTFGVKAGDGMYLAPEERLSVW